MEYSLNQKGEDAILDNRRALKATINTIAPPVQLFNPLFAYFSSKAFDPDYDVPSEFFPDVLDFMAKSALLYGSEEERQLYIKKCLENVLGRPLPSTVNPDNTRPDFQVVGTFGIHTAYLAVGEEKNEFGDGGSDPSTQVGLSYWHLFRQTEVNPFRSPTIFFAVADACNTEKHIRSEDLLSSFSHRPRWAMAYNHGRHHHGQMCCSTAHGLSLASYSLYA
jgi:hypothetical protein